MTTARRPTADRKREIADAAIQVIARDGLGKFTASSLAQHIGLTNGALFRHFSSMDEIVSAAIDRAEEILFEGFPPENEDPIDRLGSFFCQRLKAIRAHPSVVRVVYSNELGQAAGAEGAARVRDFKRRSVALVRDCLDEAAKRGLLTDAGTPAVIAPIVLGAIMAQSLLPDKGDSRPSSGASPEAVWTTLEKLIRAKRLPPVESKGAAHRSRSRRKENKP